MYVQGNNDWRSRNQRRRGKTVNISYSDCASVIRHAMRMRCIILPSEPFLALPHFSTLPHTLHDFRKQIIEHKYILPFSSELSSETFLTPRRNEQDTGFGRNTWQLGKTAVSGIVGVGDLSLSALLARPKAFQLHGELVCRASGFRCGDVISKTTILSLWFSGYFVCTSIFIRTTVSLVAMLYCCGWETAEKQCLPQKENVHEDSLYLELLRTSNKCVRLLSEVLGLRECAVKGRHLTHTIFRKWIL